MTLGEGGLWRTPIFYYVIYVQPLVPSHCFVDDLINVVLKRSVMTAGATPRLLFLNRRCFEVICDDSHFKTTLICSNV